MNKFEAGFLFQISLKMRSVASYTLDSLVKFEAKRLFKCSSYFFTVPKWTKDNRVLHLLLQSFGDFLIFKQKQHGKRNYSRKIL
ncbi:MAG: Unknown protein [uncultured Sulfurovum sp.]|uniref:Uncharacterized protein n=1 Tax=uncultured Sulfurovum sp. TaxID=269237 RepID=A0A6S6UJU6_9BACT|nr:MAG: Unknown protein [uncultured Sulfurovum sp.]